MHICNTTTKLVFVVLFLRFSFLFFHREKSERLPPSHAMGKRNYLKTDRSSRKSLNRKALIAGAALVVLYLLASCIFGEMGLIKYYRMQAQYNSLTQEIATLEQDNARLLRDVHALKTDPDYLEILARDKLGLARQGEIVYYYGEP